MRLIVQSLATGRFLAPSLDDGTPEWVGALRDAGGGVVRDPEAALQLLEDNTEPEDRAVIVDLDRLGTAQDYQEPAAPAGGAPCAPAGREAGSPSLPVGNHGE